VQFDAAVAGEGARNDVMSSHDGCDLVAGVCHRDRK
jgi:hypothetical protein